MVFTDPARFALAAIHDAEIKLGDRVAIFGLGAIGMLALQMARLDGAAQVIAVDPIPERLELAHQLGADLTINPEENDAGMTIKQATGGRGRRCCHGDFGSICLITAGHPRRAQRGAGGDRQLLRRSDHSPGSYRVSGIITASPCVPACRSGIVPIATIPCGTLSGWNARRSRCSKKKS